MKKQLKRLLVVSQVLVAGALFATACGGKTSQTAKTATVSQKTTTPAAKPKTTPKPAATPTTPKATVAPPVHKKVTHYITVKPSDSKHKNIVNLIVN